MLLYAVLYCIQIAAASMKDRAIAKSCG
jgi:hypothetical protein